MNAMILLYLIGIIFGICNSKTLGVTESILLLHRLIFCPCCVVKIQINLKLTSIRGWKHRIVMPLGVCIPLAMRLKTSSRKYAVFCPVAH